MKGTRHSEEQIIAILKQWGGGVNDGGVVPGARDQRANLRWKAKYGGMERGDAKKLKLEDENRKLMHVVAELTLVCTQSGPPLTRQFHLCREVSPSKAQAVPCRPLVPDFTRR